MYLFFSSFKAKVQHLQHEPFAYYIQVENQSKVVQEIVVRIFLAPIKDETGRQFSLREQRLLMIELDKFVQQGTNNCGPNLTTVNYSYI